METSILTKFLCLSVLAPLSLAAATVLPSAITVSNPQLSAGTATDFMVTFFPTATGTGAKVSGTIASVCVTDCRVVLSAILGTTNGASTIDVAWDFSVTGAPAAWTMSGDGGVTYASGGPATGPFTGSTIVNTGSFLFTAQAETPFSVVIPNNSIDFTPTAASPVPEPGTAGLALGAALVALAARARTRSRT